MKTIKLTGGYEAIVDDEDFEWLNKFEWRAGRDSKGKVVTVYRDFFGQRIKGRKIKFTIAMSTFLMGCRQNNVVDHRNRNPLDNRRENLRWATYAQNVVNCWHDSKYGRGIFKYRNHHSFVIEIKPFNRKRIRVSGFASAQEARDAYDLLALKHHGEFAMLNRDHWKGDSNA